MSNRKRKDADRGDRRGGGNGAGGGGGGQRSNHHHHHKKARPTSNPSSPSAALLAGPGIIVTCARSREKRAGNELIEILKEVAQSEYPELDLKRLPVPQKQHNRGVAVEDKEEEEGEQDQNTETKQEPRHSTALEEDLMEKSQKPRHSTALEEDLMEKSQKPRHSTALEEDLMEKPQHPAASDDKTAQRTTITSNSTTSDLHQAAASTSSTTAIANDIEAELRAELATLRETDHRAHSKNDRGGGGMVARSNPASASSLSSSSKQPTHWPPFRYIELAVECCIFISVHPSLDPLRLVQAFLTDIESTGEARSRIIQRLTPVRGFCFANPKDMTVEATKVFSTVFRPGVEATFKIEPRIRVHGTLKRDQVIQFIANALPGAQQPSGAVSGNASNSQDQHQDQGSLSVSVPKDQANVNDDDDDTTPPSYRLKADMTSPSHTIVVEIYKSQAAIAVLEHYNKWAKYNVAELMVRVRAARGMGKSVEEGEEEEEEEEVVR